MNSRSRRWLCARFGLLVRPSSKGGRRECRTPDAPANRVCKNSGRYAHALVRSHRKSSGIPRAMVLRLTSCSPRRPAFLPPSSPRSLLPRNLMPASGHQDHTTSPSASGAIRQRRISVHHIPSRVRDDREPPLGVGRDGRGNEGDLRKQGSKIFFREGLDSQITDLPVGLSHRHIGGREAESGKALGRVPTINPDDCLRQTKCTLGLYRTP